MTTGPFDTDLVVARLQANVPQLKNIELCADLAAALDGGGPPQTPWAYVLLSAETAQRSSGSSEAHVQTVTATTAVLLVVRNYRKAQLGSAVKDDLKTMVAAMRGAIVGWSPGNAFSGFNFAGGRLEKYTNAVAWWQEAYSVNYFERVIPQP